MYYLFAGDAYYPGGGAIDFLGRFDTIEEAHRALNRRMGTYDWWHITDADMNILETQNDGP